MKPRILAIGLLVILAYGCATTAPPPAAKPEALDGIASWYGEEFAGRTTANGEIFDPLLLTAAHRTFPFGTVLDITNPKTQQTVRVRVNDRGPYINNRIIDLSYAAAQKIGLIEPGIGEVNIAVVKVGSGEREAPAPMEITIAEAPKTVSVIAASEPPKVEFPIPKKIESEPPVIVDQVIVEEHRAGVVTRKQVAPDGRTIEEVPVSGAAGSQPAEIRPETADSGLRARRYTPPVKRGEFLVQVGAFSVEANAKLLQDRLTTIGQRAWIDRNDLFRVRIGPFATREQALQTRATLEANGMSAIIVAE